MVTQNGALVSVPLTTGAVAQQQDVQDYVATRAFHVRLAPKRAGTYKYWDVKDLARYEMELRKPGASYKRVDLDVAEKSFLTEGYGLKTGVAEENGMELGGNPLQVSADFLMDQAHQTLESLMFEKFLTTGIFDNDITPAVKWDVATSNPISDVRAAKIVGKKASRKPMNSAVMSEDVFEGLLQNQDILDRMPTNELRVLTQEQQLAAVFDLKEVYVSRASNITANEGASSEDAESFGSNKFLLFHKSQGDPLMNPNAGLIIIRNFGAGVSGSNGIGITSPYFDEDTDSEIIKCKLNVDFITPATSCGVLLYNVLT